MTTRRITATFGDRHRTDEGAPSPVAAGLSMTHPATTTMVGGLPMYVCNPAGVTALWQQLAQRLRACGIDQAPDRPSWPTDYFAHWRAPGLLLSQTCGYPLVTQLIGHVKVVGAFRYDVPGCEGVMCRSQLVVRSTDPATTLAAFRGRRVAFNGTDSQSGYNSLRAMVAPLARNGSFFASHLLSGGHLQSVQAVRDGLADIASIDCVTLAEIRRHAPEAAQGIRTLCESDPYPGLPLITAASTSDAALTDIRAVLADAAADPDLAPLRQDIFISGFEPLDAVSYAVCSAMQDAAFAQGYRAL